MVFFTNVAGSLLAFSMTFGFFLSCRRFSVALKLVGALGNGYLGLYTKIESTVGFSGLESKQWLLGD